LVWGLRGLEDIAGDWTDAGNTVNVKMFQLTSPDDVGVVSLVDLKHNQHHETKADIEVLQCGSSKCI